MEDIKPKRDRREYDRARRAANPEHYREYQRARRAANLDYYREHHREWRAANPDKKREQNRAYGKDLDNRAKLHAQDAIRRLIKAGRISSPYVCENCHTVGDLDAHHDDYAYPLQIRWLCRRCHQRHHAEHGESPNGAAPWYYYIAKRYKLRKKALRAIIAALPQIEQILSNPLTKTAERR